MARKEGPDLDVEAGAAADIPLTENEWQWIKVLRIICDGEVPAPNFPAGMSIKELSGCREGKCH